MSDSRAPTWRFTEWATLVARPHDHSVDACYTRAVALAAVGRLAEAREECGRFPEDERLRAIGIWADRFLNHTSATAAIGGLRELAARFPESVEPKLRLAQLELASGNQSAAEVLLEETRKLGSDEPFRSELIAAIDQHQHRESADVLDRLDKVEEEGYSLSAVGLRVRMEAYRDTNRLQDARATYAAMSKLRGRRPISALLLIWWSVRYLFLTSSFIAVMAGLAGLPWIGVAAVCVFALVVPANWHVMVARVYWLKALQATALLAGILCLSLSIHWALTRG